MNWPEATVACTFLFICYRVILNIIWRMADEKR